MAKPGYPKAFCLLVNTKADNSKDYYFVDFYKLFLIPASAYGNWDLTLATKIETADLGKYDTSATTISPDAYQAAQVGAESKVYLMTNGAKQEITQYGGIAALKKTKVTTIDATAWKKIPAYSPITTEDLPVT